MIDLINHEEFERFLNQNEHMVIVYVCAQFNDWLIRVNRKKVDSFSSFAFIGDNFIVYEYKNDSYIVHSNGEEYFLYGKKEC